MGHRIEWDNEDKTVVLQQYTDVPIKDDLYHLAEESAVMLNSVDHTVHLIIDERTIKLTLTSADIQFLEKNVPSNQGVVVMLVNKTDVSYKKFVQNFGQQLAPNAFFQTYFATTMEDARKILREKFDVKYP